MRRYLIVSVILSFLFGAMFGAPLWHAVSTAGGPAWAQQTNRQGPGGPSWLKGSADEMFGQVERHLRGLDVAMVEIAHRYDELFEASRTRNWDYAKYQTEKIDLALRLAVERRPKRARSSAVFLTGCIPPLLAAIADRDEARLDQSAAALRNGCIQCHREENVLFMGKNFAKVQPPTPDAIARIARFREQLTPEVLAAADRKAGQAVFAQQCGKCHQLFGEGGTVGPDLTHLPRSDLNYLLSRILDPNSIVGLDYQVEIVVTNDGRTVTGIVQREDEQPLDIHTATESVRIAKADIEERRKSDLSIMPEEVLDQLAPDQVRDLFGYLQSAEQPR